MSGDNSRLHSNNSPLKIYLVWHPKFAGEKQFPPALSPEWELSQTDQKDLSPVAIQSRELLQYFQRTGTELQEGLGIPVEFRSLQTGDSNLPKEIETQVSQTQLVVPFVDAKFLADSDWRLWIEQLHQQQCEIQLVSCFDAVETRWAFARRVNLTRIYDKSKDLVPKFLQRALTIRCLSILDNTSAQGTRPKIFIGSRADKSTTSELDAPVLENNVDPVSSPATASDRIPDLLFDLISREYIGIEPFWAHRSLGPGAPLEDILAAVSNSAGMIAVLTDDYLDSQWCRDEVEFAQRPRLISENSNSWRVTPIVVVDNLKHGSSRMISDFNGCFFVRWNEKKSHEIIDQVLLESLIHAFHVRWAEKIDSENNLTISWVPDPLSLLKIKSESLGNLKKKIVYPGHGVTISDREFIKDSFGGELSIVGFEEAGVDSELQSEFPLLGKIVAVSVSDNEDLLLRGYGPDHLNEFCLRITRKILGLGGSIAFGGVFGLGNFTPTLRRAAAQELNGHPSVSSSFGALPFINYQPWPWCLKAEADAELIGREVGISQFEFVYDDEARLAPDPGIPKKGFKSDMPAQLNNVKRAARASTRMRHWMAEKTDARIVVGGKRAGFVGLMPGILEESLFHLEKRKPLYVVGGFGGASEDLAYSLEGKLEELPLSMTKEGRDTYVPFQDIADAFETKPSPSLQFDLDRKSAQDCYLRLRREVQRVRESDLGNGLSERENQTVLQSECGRELVELIVAGLVRTLS